MEQTPTAIEDVLLIKPSVFTDERGFFLESYRQCIFKHWGYDLQFVQDNISYSRQYTVRGLHYQIEDPQDKLIMVPEGEILDVAVDLRRSSPTFGESVSRVLSAENNHQMFVPQGFAHGFLVRSERATVYYKCSNYYNSHGERGLKWNDPELQIEWEIEEPILSEKDEQNPRLENISPQDLFD